MYPICFPDISHISRFDMSYIIPHFSRYIHVSHMLPRYFPYIPFWYVLYNPTFFKIYPCIPYASQIFPTYPVLIFPIYMQHLSQIFSIFSPRLRSTFSNIRGFSRRLTCSAQLRSGRIAAPRVSPARWRGRAGHSWIWMARWEDGWEYIMGIYHGNIS